MMLERESHVTTMANGQRLHCWINRPLEARFNGCVVMIATAFGRRMHHVSALTQYLTESGFAVVRFDPVDHVGLSDGEIFDYTLSAGLRSLAQAFETVRSMFPTCRAGIIATSMTGRIAFEQLAGSNPPDFLITMAGVVDVQRTLSAVYDIDYAALAYEDLPERMTFEGHEIDIHAYYRDGHANRWFGRDRPLDILQASSTPIVAFAGSHDEWVDPADVAACEAASGNMTVIRLAGCGHDITRHAAIARELALDAVRWCGRLGLSRDIDVIEPSHAAILGVSLQERRMQRSGA
jgi:acyl transferase